MHGRAELSTVMFIVCLCCVARRIRRKLAGPNTGGSVLSGPLSGL
jgi:hypothetical protein